MFHILPIIHIMQLFPESFANMRMFILKLLITLLLPFMVYATIPDKVVFGVYPVSIYNLDPVNSSFNISFYAWWRTTNKNYHPESSIEIINARDYNYKLGEGGHVGNEYFTSVHYYAKIHHVWESKYFPFVRHYLEVKMEDFSDANLISFEPDLLKSGLHSELIIPGWKIIGFNLKKSTTHYNTNFGDTSDPENNYSRLTFNVEVKHEGWRIYMSYFIGFFMAAILAHLIYLMSNFPFPGRATTFMGAVFSFTGNKYITDQSIPITSEFSLADAIQVATFFVIIISIASAILIEYLPERDYRRKKTSYIIGGASLIVYTAFISYATYVAAVS